MVTKNEQAVAPVEANGQLPVGYDLQDIMGDAGVGSSDMGAGDLGIPYLSVLQSNSPQAMPGHAKYIEGATAGMFLNSATGEVFKGPIVLIPAAYERKYVQWKDRDMGEGGYVMDHPIDSDILTRCKPNAKGKPALENGDVIWETAYQYFLMENPNSGRLDQVVFPMKSTMLGKNRRLNNLIAGAVIPGTSLQAPRWMYGYEFRTVMQTKGNNSWYNIEIEKLNAPVSAEAYVHGKKFNAMFAAGAIQRAAETDDLGGDAAAPVGQHASASDDDVPY